MGRDRRQEAVRLLRVRGFVPVEDQIRHFGLHRDGRKLRHDGRVRRRAFRLLCRSHAPGDQRPLGPAGTLSMLTPNAAMMSPPYPTLKRGFKKKQESQSGHADGFMWTGKQLSEGRNGRCHQAEIWVYPEALHTRD